MPFISPPFVQFTLQHKVHPINNVPSHICRALMMFHMGLQSFLRVPSMPFVIRKASTLIDPLGKLQSCFYCYPKMVAVVWPHHSREAYPSWKRTLIWLCTLSANRWKNKCECEVPSTKTSVNWEENISTIKRLREELIIKKMYFYKVYKLK